MRFRRVPGQIAKNLPRSSKLLGITHGFIFPALLVITFFNMPCWQSCSKSVLLFNEQPRTTYTSELGIQRPSKGFEIVPKKTAAIYSNFCNLDHFPVIELFRLLKRGHCGRGGRVGRPHSAMFASLRPADVPMRLGPARCL